MTRNFPVCTSLESGRLLRLTGLAAHLRVTSLFIWFVSSLHEVPAQWLSKSKIRLKENYPNKP